jgi:ABC-type sulfate transport system substrate-binding protein
VVLFNSGEDVTNDWYDEMENYAKYFASLLAATLYQGNPDRNHRLWNIVLAERYILHTQVLLECCYI